MLGLETSARLQPLQDDDQTGTSSVRNLDTTLRQQVLDITEAQ
jgi:hypothetical protein